MNQSEVKYFVNSLRSTLSLLEVSLHCSIIYILDVYLSTSYDD